MKVSVLYFIRVVAVMVVLPIMFILVYPLGYLVLPEPVARLADLPQDLMIFLLIEGAVVPPVGFWLFARDQYRASPARAVEAHDTRDVF